MLGGGAVAEDGARAASEDGGHPAALVAEAAVADGVDGAVDPVQAAGRGAPFHAGAAEPGLHQLGKGH